MKSIIIGFLIIALAFAHYGCIHNKIIKGKKLIPIDDTATSSRLLQQLPFGPIRFHMIYNSTQIDSTTPEGTTIMKMMNIIQLFWQKTIEVYYQPSLSFNVAAGIDRSYVQCLTIVVPQQIISNPIPNVDYGVFVAAVNEGNNGASAYSYPCAFSLTSKQPNWGMINWNLNYFKFDLISFQMNIKIGIHQFTHLLGFSNILYDNYLNGKYVTQARGSYINGTYMQKALKDQYGCTNAPGMLLQANGGSGTAQSHWSYKAAYNEFMTAGVQLSNPTISYITLALLEETGWYKSIFKGYGEFINWGRNKGCSIIQDGNCTSNQYCTNQNEMACDYDGTGLGYCKNQTLSSCLFVKFYLNFICTDPNYDTKNKNANITNITGQGGGQYSRCFESNLVVNGGAQPKYNFRCYKVVCSASGRTITIQIGNTYGLCLYPKQNITISGYSGYLTCPKSFKNICAIKRCPNQCNGNGVCLGGRCLCSKSYTGESCSQITSVGFSSRSSLQVAQNNHNCLSGSYLSHYGYCQPCKQKKCKKCDKNGCIECTNGALPSLEGQCQ